jgi:hypothetical protein
MHRIPQDRYTRHEVTASRAGSPSGRTAFWGTGMGEFRVSGFSLPAKMTHLSDDKTVAKMGHQWWYRQMWATRPPSCGGTLRCGPPRLLTRDINCSCLVMARYRVVSGI